MMMNILKLIAILLTTGDSGSYLAIFYDAVAVLWLAGILINWKKQSDTLWKILHHAGICVLVITATATLWHATRPGSAGLGGLFHSAYILTGGLFALLYVILFRVTNKFYKPPKQLEASKEESI